MNYPAIPVVPSSDSLKSSPRFDIFSMSKRLLSPVFLFFLARLLLFIWIFYFESALGVYIMIWLFYSILELNHERMIFISRYTLIPVLTLISFLTYTLNTFAVSTSEFFGIYYKSSPCAEYLFQALTILTLLFINRVLGYKNKSTEITTETKDVFGIIYTVVQQNSDKLSLIILFLVGLSNISLFHIGFILICLIFLIDIKLARKYWKVLMFYTMAILLIRYIWQLLIPVISHTDSELLNFIGLPTTSIMNAKTLLILPYDYSIWILLFSAGIQNRAFGSTMFSIDYYKLTKADFRNKHNLIVNYIVNIYEWYTIFQVWVSYFFIFLIMLVSPLNILNYVRFACFCTFMLIHLKEITTEISFNYLAVKKLWGVTVYYSGVLLIVRYLYQFIPYLHFAFDTQFVLIGIEVYKDSDLYGYMVADCTLLLFSILESRNRQDDIDRDSFEFEEVGFLTGIIRANQSLLGQEKHVITALQYLEEPFPLLVLLVVSSLAVYWKLSLSMLCYLAAMGWYLLRLGNYFGQVVEHKELYSAEFEWELRVRSWRVLFFITFVNFILSYAEFLVTPVIFGDVVYQKVLWLYFCCGFSKTQGDTLISVNYGYAILWVLLIIERHCIEFMLKTRVNISQEEEFKRLLNKNVVLMKTLDFLRVFAEGLVPMLVLLIAFNKLTFISIVYVFAVFLGIIFASPYKRTHILNMVVIVSIWLQYFLILSNIQATNSPDALPKDRKISNSPWYTRVNWTTSDDPVFLNLGTDIEQLHNTYPDLLCSLCIMIYYKFLCTKEHELFLIEHGTIEEPATSQGKNIFAWVKKAIYNLSHMIIFLFVLLFIIQNNGLISGVYCLFCLRFIYGANEVIRSEEGWNKYLKILRMYFLTFMLLDLTCNILIQIPFGLIDISNNSWLVAIGVQRLWRAGQDSAPPNESSLHAKVDFKIVAFAFLYMMYRMMRSKDFNDHMALERADFNAQGHTTGYLLAKEFNDSRIAENARFQEKRARFETELKKLDVNVQKWNQKFYEEKRDSLGVTRNRGATVRRKTTILKEQPKINNESTFKSRFQNLLISLINPVIFQNYLEKIRAHGNIRISFDEEEVKIDEDEGKICEVEGEKLEEEGEMNEKGKDKAESFMEINFFNKKVLDEYNLTWKNYFMMCGLILMSNTQILFFLSCIMNHLIYASLESIIFPLSVLGYAMLEYPRPPFLYFRIMMIYAELIFFIKFTIQFEIWELLFGQTYMRNYQDAYKIGFNLAGNTYSSTLLYYVVWDVVVMLFILLHEYSLLRVGLWKYTEYEMETFDDAKLRIERKVSKVLRKKKKNWKASGLLLRATTEIKNFLNRLLPKNKEEKPGKDLYTPTICVQFLILLYLFIFFSKMDGKGMDISKSFR